MILKILTIALLYIGLFETCKAQSIKLGNTKWIYYLKDCKEYIEFSDKSNYKENSCEIDGITYGKYIQNGNEVILEQLSGQYDEDFPKDSHHRTQRVKYKLNITGNKMHYVEKWDLNIWGKWVKSDFKFSEEYIFKKEEKR